MNQEDRAKAMGRGHVAYLWPGWDLRSSRLLAFCLGPGEHGEAGQHLSRHPQEGHPVSGSPRCIIIKPTLASSAGLSMEHRITPQ